MRLVVQGYIQVCGKEGRSLKYKLTEKGKELLRVR